MRLTSLLKTAVAIAAAAVLGHAGTALAAPNASLSPDTDAFRTGGCTGCFITQMNSVTAAFQEITRVFRGCYAGGTIVNDGSGCADGVNGRLADFVVIQGVLKNSTTDPNGLGVPNGPSLGEVTYRVSANGSGVGISCSRTAPTPVGIGFLAPEGFDGAPNTADDAGGTGTFGVPGPGINANSSSMSAAPLTACNTKIAAFETVPGTTNTFDTAVNGELCVVNYDLNSNGSIANDVNGSGLPGALTTVGSVANNETTNLRVSCDTGFADLPTGDFLPPKEPFNQADVFGAQIFKIVASRDAHASSGTNDKIHLNDPQIENIFGEPANNSVCRLPHVGAASTSASQNVTACIRVAGSGTRETFRNTFMADTAGSKTQSEDNSGAQNGTTTSCLQTKEAGGTQISTKRVKVGAGNADVINCLNSFTGSFGYPDADRFDPAFASVVVEGVDVDAAIVANTLKDLVKCGHYRYWGPLAGGIGQHNPGGSAFITAHRASLKKQAVYAASQAYLPMNGVGFTKNATDGAYSIAFLPTSCPAAPPAPLSISASPTTLP